jgi:hypothetical protein
MALGEPDRHPPPRQAPLGVEVAPLNTDVAGAGDEPFDVPLPQGVPKVVGVDFLPPHPTQHRHRRAQPILPVPMRPVRLGKGDVSQAQLHLELGLDQVLPRFALLDVAHLNPERAKHPFVRR